MTKVTGRSEGRAAGFIALGCVGFIASAPALAADAPAVGADQIVVSGVRPKEIDSPKATAAILNTPRTVSVVTEEVLDNTASFSFEEALRTVPGITLGAGEGGTASADIPLIRGVDASADVFVDNVRDIGTQTRETFAIERIEVFKGPNGAFGGRGAAAGGINIVTKSARAGTFGRLTGTLGTDDLYRVSADVNAQMGERFAVRVAALYHDARAAGRDAVFDDRWGVLPSITYGVGTPTVASLSYYHLETDGLPDYGIPLTSPGQLPGGVRRPAAVDYDNFYGLAARDFQTTRIDAVTFQMRHDLGNGIAVSNVTRYADSRNAYIVTNPDDSAGNVANGTVWRNIKSRDALTRTLASNLNLSADFATGRLAHALSVGAEYSYADTDNVPYTATVGGRVCTAGQLAAFNCTGLAEPTPDDPWAGTIGRSALATAEAEDLSVYAFDTVTIVPELIVTGGIRYTDYAATGTGSTRGVPFRGDLETDFVTWQTGIVLKPARWASVYASYANAKNPPGTDVGAGSGNIAVANDTYAPQRTENYELGAKADLFGNALQVSAALFQVNRDNIVNTDGLGAITEIIDTARVRGVEVGATGRAGPFNLFGGYTYVDSSVGGTDLALPNTPAHNVSITASVDATPRFNIGGGIYHQSGRFADAANLISADGYVRFDAFASYDLADNLAVQLNVQNVGDERYIAKLRNPHFAVPGAGRRALVSLTARY